MWTLHQTASFQHSMFHPVKRKNVADSHDVLKENYSIVQLDILQDVLVYSDQDF